jgi:hypothetical protein
MQDDEISYKQIFEHFRKAFDRPAFKGAYHWHSMIVPFEQAISDTILAVDTGLRKTRQGILIDKGEGNSKSDIKNMEWRSKMDDIETHLSNIQISMRKGDMNALYIDGGAIDEDRKQIINTLNKIFESMGIPLLPLPTEAKEMSDVWPKNANDAFPWPSS